MPSQVHLAYPIACPTIQWVTHIKIPWYDSSNAKVNLICQARQKVKMRMARQTISSAISTISIHSKSFQAKTKTKAKKRPEDCDSPKDKKKENTTKNLAGNKSWDQPRFRAQIKYNKRLKDTLRKNLWRPPLQEAEEFHRRAREKERERQGEWGREGPKIKWFFFFLLLLFKILWGQRPLHSH